MCSLICEAMLLLLKYNHNNQNIFLGSKISKLHFLWQVYSQTTLQCAAKYGRVNIVDFLMDRGADIDHRDAVSFSSKLKGQVHYFKCVDLERSHSIADSSAKLPKKCGAFSNLASSKSGHQRRGRNTGLLFSLQAARITRELAYSVCPLFLMVIA